MRRDVQEVVAGLWCWTAPHPDWRPNRSGIGGWEQEVTSYLLECPGRQAVLVDPLLPDTAAFSSWLDDHLENRACDVLLTVGWHVRSAAFIRNRYAATVWGNPRTREDSGDLVTGVIHDGDSLPGGAIAFTPIPNDAGEAETAYWFPHWRALAVGDVLVNTPAGLRVWWEQTTEALRSEYRERARPALTRLLDLPIEMVLTTHGSPVTRDGHAALRHALDAPTWERPKEA